MKLNVGAIAGRGKSLAYVVVLCLCLWGVSAVRSANAGTTTADWPQWRGPQRDGISRETGLLKQWPAGGP